MKTTKFLFCAAATLALGGAYATTVSGWINETSATIGTTGEWTGDTTPTTWSEGWAVVENATFAPTNNNPQSTVTTTITTKLKFSDVGEEDPESGTQAALRIVEDETDSKLYWEVWATVVDENSDTVTRWVKMARGGDGDDAPEKNTDYEVVFAFNYTDGNYTVSVDGTELGILDDTVPEDQPLQIASAASCVSAVVYKGEGQFQSLTGSYEAAGEVDWPADPTQYMHVTAGDAFGITGDLAYADAADLAYWATNNGVDYADRNTSILKDAFLLGCANTQVAIDAAKEEFKITSISVAADGTVTITPASYGNGKVVIKGTTTLTPASWHDKTDGDQFFKATLEVDAVTP